ncbi:IclR family transcriptional regulator [Microvirga sp. TS319]|uniref:IclR family transcriptional regulator n=1 Tax=Microvirga sp. TS319 TaxID=3241165 RepID=UPI00351A61BD
MSDTVRSAARVLDILEYLAGTPDGATLSECVSSLGMPKSSTLMLLRTVASRGYAIKDSDDRYRLNNAFAKYGFGWGGHRLTRLMAIAEPIMGDLCRAVGETVLLGVSGAMGIKTIAKVVSDQIVHYDHDISVEIAPYCTAMGRVLMAYSPVQQVDSMLSAWPLVKRTPKTVTNIDELRQIIKRTHDQGYAIVEEEFASGGTGIAAPIFDQNRQILAMLDVGAVTSRFHDKRDMVIQRLCQSAEQVTNAINHKSAS